MWFGVGVLNICDTTIRIKIGHCWDVMVAGSSVNSDSWSLGLWYDKLDNGYREVKNYM